MQYVSFNIGERQSFGVLQDGMIREATERVRSEYRDLKFLLAGGVRLDPEIDFKDELIAPDDVQFIPVICMPSKIICVGVNYRPHVEEMGRTVPDKPVLFVRFETSQVGHNVPIVRPRASEQYDFEGELAVVIAHAARHVPRERALDYVAGYSCFMDGTVRDWQTHTPQFTAGKNFYRSGSFGPALVTPDEVGDPTALRLETRVNGATMQRGNVSDLIFDIPCLIEYCSTFTHLFPGDVISTGTPGGVGAARTPPAWLKAGDVVEVDIPGVGCLSNPVIDE